MELINIEVIGLEKLDKEFNDELNKINNQIPKALEYVGSEMISSLKKHIQQDWYKKYTPSVYERRNDNPTLGTPLGDDENITNYVDKFTKSMKFLYVPTGRHKRGDNHSGMKGGIRRDSDELIESIQTGKLMGNPPPRPFWNNFVEEQKNGEIINNFIQGMKPFSVSLDTDGNDLIFNGNESLLEAGNEQLTMDYDAELFD